MSGSTSTRIWRASACLLYTSRFGEFTMALGVLYDDPRPTFEADVWRQNKAAAEGKKADLQSLLKKGQTWTVSEGGPDL